MESSDIDSDTTSKREMETSDEMVADSETNPDLAPIVKEISETKIESDSESESESDSMEDKGYKTSTKPNRAEVEYEMVKFQVYSFFKDNPETEEEKKMKKRDIYSQIKIQHEKCRELQELALENTKMFQLMKKISLRFSKELSIDHTFQELTKEAENLMLEYGMCVDTDSKRKDLDDMDLKAEMDLEVALKLPNKVSYANVNLETPADFRPIEDCARDVLMVHLTATGDEEKVRNRLKVQARALEDSKAREKANEKAMSGSDAKEREMESSMEIKGAEDSNTKKKPRPRRCYYRVYMGEEILNHRINFLKALQEMARSSLRLFRRFNKAWLKPGETLIERTLEQVKEQMRERCRAIDKRYFWDDWRDDVKEGDKETCRPDEKGAFKETMPADEKGAFNPNPLTRKCMEEILAAEVNWGKNLKALHNAARIVLSSDSFRSTLAAGSVPDAEVAGSVPDAEVADSVPDAS